MGVDTNSYAEPRTLYAGAASFWSGACLGALEDRTSYRSPIRLMPSRQTEVARGTVWDCLSGPSWISHKKAALPAARLLLWVMLITHISWRVGPAMGPLSAGVRQLPLFGCIGSTHPLDCDVACASETLLPQNGNRMRPRGPNNLRQVAHPHVIHTHTLRDGRMRKQTMRAHSPRGCRAKGCGLPPEVAPPQGRALPGLLFTVLAVVPVKLLVMAMAQRATVIQGLADTR